MVSLKPIVEQATADRRALVRDIGLLIESARRGDAASAAEAGKIGRERVAGFRAAVGRLDALEEHRPPLCGLCHEVVRMWLQVHISASEALIEAGQRQDPQRLRVAQRLMGDGRRYVQRFNAEYTRLIDALKRGTIPHGAAPGT